MFEDMEFILFLLLAAASKLNRRSPAGRRRLRVVVSCSRPLTIKPKNSAPSMIRLWTWNLKLSRTRVRESSIEINNVSVAHHTTNAQHLPIKLIWAKMHLKAKNIFLSKTSSLFTSGLRITRNLWRVGPCAPFMLRRISITGYRMRASEPVL